jgi:hypothetical protein
MSEHFSAEWLALREPADVRGRSEQVVRTLADALPSDGPVRILDLASGTGSNARYLAPRLWSRPGPVASGVGPAPNLRWLLVDHDPHLLSRARALVPFEVATKVVDLTRLEHDAGWFEGHDLVTASALLDLVSEAWVRTLLTRCHAIGAHVLFALSYDGRIECSPRDSNDDLVLELVNRHQRTDKGFGLALGPAAAQRTASVLRDLGYQVATVRSDWQLGTGDAELQRRLIDGWASAAAQLAPDRATAIEEWRAQRQRSIDRGASRITVGHVDVAGLAPPRGSAEPGVD